MEVNPFHMEKGTHCCSSRSGGVMTEPQHRCSSSFSFWVHPSSVWVNQLVHSVSLIMLSYRFSCKLHPWVDPSWYKSENPFVIPNWGRSYSNLRSFSLVFQASPLFPSPPRFPGSLRFYRQAVVCKGRLPELVWWRSLETYRLKRTTTTKETKIPWTIMYSHRSHMPVY